MYSARVASQVVSKWLSGTTVVGAGAVRSLLPAVASAPRIHVPGEARSETRSLIPWAPVSSRARILRE